MHLEPCVLMQAEQGLAAAALYVADMRKEVNQRQAELRAAERERRVGAALAGQLPRLQRWQSMQVKSALILTFQWTSTIVVSVLWLSAV